MNRREAIKATLMAATAAVIPMRAATLPEPWVLERSLRSKLSGEPPNVAEDVMEETYRLRRDGKAFHCFSFASTSCVPHEDFAGKMFSEWASVAGYCPCMTPAEFLEYVESHRELWKAEYV